MDLLKFPLIILDIGQLLRNLWGFFIPSNTFQVYGKAYYLWVTPAFLDTADKDQREETMACCNSVPAGRRLHVDGKMGRGAEMMVEFPMTKESAQTWGQEKLFFLPIRTTCPMIKMDLDGQCLFSGLLD